MGGAVRGSYNDNGQVVFNVGSAVSRAEAAVIVDRLLATEDVTVHAMAAQAVPAWASQSVANLETVSVLADPYDMSEPLTRGEAAQMLAAMQDVLANRDTGWF